MRPVARRIEVLDGEQQGALGAAEKRRPGEIEDGARRAGGGSVPGSPVVAEEPSERLPVGVVQVGEDAGDQIAVGPSRLGAKLRADHLGGRGEWCASRTVRTWTLRPTGSSAEAENATPVRLRSMISMSTTPGQSSSEDSCGADRECRRRSMGVDSRMSIGSASGSGVFMWNVPWGEELQADEVALSLASSPSGLDVPDTYHHVLHRGSGLQPDGMHRLGASGHGDSISAPPALRLINVNCSRLATEPRRRPTISNRGWPRRSLTAQPTLEGGVPPGPAPARTGSLRGVATNRPNCPVHVKSVQHA